jgi:serine/threonine protein kinase
MWDLYELHWFVLVNISLRMVLTSTPSRLAREMVVWVKLDHPNILKFKGFFIDQQQHLCYIVCPYAAHGNVTQYLERSPDNQTEKFDLVRALSSLLLFCHSPRSHMVIVTQDQ